MKKTNLHERLVNRKIKKPSRFFGFFILRAFKRISRKNQVKFTYDLDRKKLKDKQIILLCKHASRDDYIYTIAGYGSCNIHVICGYQNFFSKYLYSMLIKMGVIAKYLYAPDRTAVKHMLQVIKEGRSIVLFPEGIQSTSGSTHPINPATMKFLYKCKVPVVLCSSYGAYMTRPRYSKVRKVGQMIYHYEYLFKEEDYEKFSYDELYEKLLIKFKYNDFEYNKKARVAYHGECENIAGLDKIIYKCPCCGSEFKFDIHGSNMSCLDCGFEVMMNEYYDLLPVNKNLPFTNIDLWYKWQRKEVAKEVIKDNFQLKMEVDAFCLNIHKIKKDNLVHLGEGILTMTNHYLTYEGVINDEVKKIVFDLAFLPSLSFTPGIDFEFYYDEKHYCYKPKENNLQVVKWMLACEEINFLHNEAWFKAKKEVYDE